MNGGALPQGTQSARHALKLALLASFLSVSQAQPQVLHWYPVPNSAIPLGSLGCPSLGSGNGNSPGPINGTWRPLHFIELRPQREYFIFGLKRDFGAYTGAVGDEPPIRPDTMHSIDGGRTFTCARDTGDNSSVFPVRFGATVFPTGIDDDVVNSSTIRAVCIAGGRPLQPTVSWDPYYRVGPATADVRCLRSQLANGVARLASHWEQAPDLPSAVVGASYAAQLRRTARHTILVGGVRTDGSQALFRARFSGRPGAVIPTGWDVVPIAPDSSSGGLALSRLRPVASWSSVDGSVVVAGGQDAIGDIALNSIGLPAPASQVDVETGFARRMLARSDGFVIRSDGSAFPLPPAFAMSHRQSAEDESAIDSATTSLIAHMNLQSGSTDGVLLMSGSRVRAWTATTDGSFAIAEVGHRLYVANVTATPPKLTSEAPASFLGTYGSVFNAAMGGNYIYVSAVSPSDGAVFIGSTQSCRLRDDCAPGFYSSQCRFTPYDAACEPCNTCNAASGRGADGCLTVAHEVCAPCVACPPGTATLSRCGRVGASVHNATHDVCEGDTFGIKSPTPSVGASVDVVAAQAPGAMSGASAVTYGLTITGLCASLFAGAALFRALFWRSDSSLDKPQAGHSSLWTSAPFQCRLSSALVCYVAQVTITASGAVSIPTRIAMYALMLAVRAFVVAGLLCLRRKKQVKVTTWGSQHLPRREAAARDSRSDSTAGLWIKVAAASFLHPLLFLHANGRVVADSHSRRLMGVHALLVDLPIATISLATASEMAQSARLPGRAQALALACIVAATALYLACDGAYVALVTHLTSSSTGRNQDGRGTVLPFGAVVSHSPFQLATRVAPIATPVGSYSMPPASDVAGSIPAATLPPPGQEPPNWGALHARDDVPRHEPHAARYDSGAQPIGVTQDDGGDGHVELMLSQLGARAATPAGRRLARMQVFFGLHPHLLPGALEAVAIDPLPPYFASLLDLLTERGQFVSVPQENGRRLIGCPEREEAACAGTSPAGSGSSGWSYREVSEPLRDSDAGEVCL